MTRLTSHAQITGVTEVVEVTRVGSARQGALSPRASPILLMAPLAMTLLLLATSGGAQQRRSSMPSAATFTVLAESGTPEIPFELVNNHLLLEMAVNGSSPLRIALDTGMPADGLAVYDGPRTQSLGLNINPSIQAQVGGAGGDGKRRVAQIALEESVTLAGLRIDKMRVILMPEMSEFALYHDGIIGATLFERYTVELDYDAKVLRLHEPATFEPAPGAMVVPLRFISRLPYASVQLSIAAEQSFDATVVVDLGASHAISLNTDADDQIVAPAGAVDTVVGRGLSGELLGQVGRIRGLWLEGAHFEDVVATFPTSEHQNPRGVDSLGGNLGSEVLRRFKTTFDYANRRMLLQPNRSFGEPFRFDRSGLRLSWERL